MSEFLLPDPVYIGLPAKFTNWRVGQDRAVLRAVESDKRFVCLAMPTGAGKSPAYIAAALMSGQRVCVLTSTRGLQSQLVSDFADSGLVDIRGQNNYPCLYILNDPNEGPPGPIVTSCEEGPCHSGVKCELQKGGCTYFDALAVARSEPLVVTNYSYWMKQLEVKDTLLKQFGMLVLDECFVAGTLVGSTPIETIAVGDIVPSWNPQTNSLCSRRVIHLFKNKPHGLVRVTLSGGNRVVCTPNHPFWTPCGWAEAKDLTIFGDVLCLTHEIPKPDRDSVSHLRNDSGRFGSEGLLPLQENKEMVLLGKVSAHQVQSDRKDTRSNARRSTTDALRTDETKKPNEDQKKQGENEDNAACDGLETSGSWWQWERPHVSRVATGFHTGLGTWGDCFLWESPSWIADTLQVGRGKHQIEGSDRSRRMQSPNDLPTETRSEKGKVFDWVRVESVEVLEQTSDGTFGGMCPDGFVYNLEVEGAHTYVANGTVVHNCHDALERLGEHLAVELWPKEQEWLAGFDLDNWKVCSKVCLAQCFNEIENLSANVRRGDHSRELLSHIRFLKRLESKMQRLALARSEWVWQQRRQGRDASVVYRFDPVWPAEYAERHLFGGIPRVVLTSATIRPKTLDLLGIDRNAVDFCEYPSSFGVASRPVYWIPTVRVDKRATPAHLNAWVAKMDSIIAQRLDRKGIIHSVSFEKAKIILNRSEHKHCMILNDSTNTQAVVKAFKERKPPLILVSPSVSTGYDFPFDQARYQIVAKLPFPDSRDLVLKARTEKDKLYGMYQMVQTLVQMCGRIVRSESDYGESFILDDHFEWVYNKHKNLMPRWFIEAVQKSRTIPAPKEI